MRIDDARAMIAKAHQRAAEIGIQVAAAVVDSGGNPVAFERMDGTQLASLTIAAGKAYTAISWQRPSGELWPIAQPGADGFGINSIDQRFVLSPGGLPVRRDETIIGAIGVSGGTGEQDEDCARAALQ
ncbi:heme-binding protein [Mesorhizobium sp. NZP2298]|uniref:GlcG/HbpS family heme-binding protein n=2 Tax=Mesorhizobium sp. NZP2298 TaxID=2483403 RepID=UPI001599611E|nr:heme-binding protein [Mesorhizobium sp. NZP2298]QKC96602.1 heme-binding protein [Mesorhizobium sp. NZP2298]